MYISTLIIRINAESEIQQRTFKNVFIFSLNVPSLDLSNVRSLVVKHPGFFMLSGNVQSTFCLNGLLFVSYYFGKLLPILSYHGTWNASV